MQTLRIFISSPGDVAEERERAQQVVESLRRRFAGRFVLKPVLWEDLPLQADASFQAGIDLMISEAHGIDIAIFILWSRLGSPLGSSIRKVDDTEYRSGTERELDLMLQARRQSGGARPMLLVYTRRDATSFDERLRGKSTREQEDLIAQKKLVEEFITEEFHDAAGSNIRAYHTFDRPVTFSQRMRAHLLELLEELAGGGDAEVVWDIEKQGAPFLGLEAFQAQHADVFCGRDEEILEARHLLREQARNGCAFLLLSGASGSGKSSLARAGVLPTVVENELDDQVSAWRTVIATPAELGADLLLGLVDRLAADEVLPELLGAQSTSADVASDLRRDPQTTARRWFKEAFASAAKRHNGGVRLLLVLDQLEELFTTTTLTDTARKEFLDAVEALARNGNVWVLATARSDFGAQLQAQPALVRMMEGRGLLPVLPPQMDCLRQLIEEPARLAGLVFEKRGDQSLADRILRDSAGHAELLPLLEYVLRELFEQRAGKLVLNWQAYETLGGVEGALAKRAEDVFEDLPEEAQQALNGLLKALVTIGQEEGAGSDDKIVRQRVLKASVARTPGASALVDALVRDRLLTAAVDPATGEAVVSVAHESLLRVWPRAITWAQNNRDFLRTRARLRIALKAWQEENARTDGQGKPDDLLLPEGKSLEDARAISTSHADDLTTEEHRFVRASAEHHQQRRDQELQRERERRELAEQLRADAEFQRARAEEQREQTERHRAEAVRRQIIARRFATAALVLAIIAGLSGYLAWRARLLAEERENKATALLFLNRADQMTKEGNEESALALTKAAHLKQAGFETRNALLNRLTGASPYFKQVFDASGDGVTALSWSGDSARLACGVRTGSIHVLEEGHPVPAIVSPQGNQNDPQGVLDLCFGDKATSLAAVLESGLYQLRDLTSPSQVNSTTLDTSFLISGAISPNRKRIAYAHTVPSLAELRDAGGTETIGKHPIDPALPEDPSCFRFSPDSTRLAIGFSGGGLTILEADKPREMRIPDQKAILAAAWQPEGKQLAISVQEKGVEIWDTGLAPVKASELKVSVSNITSLDWNHFGGQLAAASGKEVKLWKPASDSSEANVPFSARHRSNINSVRWSPDGQWLASGDDDGIVKIWSTKQRSVVRYFDAGTPLHGLSASPDGKWIAAGTDGGRVLLWNTATQVLEHEINNGSSAVHALAWQPHGDALACADKDGTVRLYRPPWQKPDKDLAGRHGAIWQIKWMADGKSLFFSSDDWTVGRWNPNEPTATIIHTLPGAALGLAVSPDGARVAMSSTDGTITVQRSADGKIVANYKAHQDSIGCLDWSPDGRRLASAGNDGSIAVSDPDAGKVIRLLKRLPAGNEVVYFEAVVFSPDGKQLAAAGQGGSVHVWDTGSGEPLWQVTMHKDKRIWHLQWSAPELLLTSSSDGRVGCLDPREQSWIARATELTQHIKTDPSDSAVQLPTPAAKP